MLIPVARSSPGPARLLTRCSLVRRPQMVIVMRTGNEANTSVPITSEQACRSLTGNLYVDYEPDHGKNFNDCIFRPPSTGGGNQTGGGVCGPISPVWQTGIVASDPEPAVYDSTLCMQWNWRVTCRATIEHAQSLVQSNQLADAQRNLAALVGTGEACPLGADPTLLAQAQALLAQVNAQLNPSRAGNQAPSGPSMGAQCQNGMLRCPDGLC